MKKLVISSVPELAPGRLSREDVFLGPWCFCDRDDVSFFDHVGYDVVASPWDTFEDFDQGTKYIEGLYRKILDAITEYANTIHGKDHGPDFWDKLCHAWLNEWITFCLDVHSRLRATEKHGPLQADVFDGYQPRIESYSKYSILQNTLYFEAAVTSDIILNATDLDWLTPRAVAVDQESLRRRIEVADPFTALAKSKPRPWTTRLRDYMMPRSRLFFGNVSGLLPHHELYFLLRLDPLALLRRPSARRTVHPADPGLVESTPLAFRADTPFEALLGKLLPRYLPEIVKNYEQYTFRRRVFALGYHHYRNGHEYYYSHLKPQKGQWYSVQHGCGYGDRLFPTMSREFALVDKFITWGWTMPESKPDDFFVPMPSPHLTYLPKSPQSERNRLLYAGSLLYSAFTYRLKKGEHVNATFAQTVADRIDFLGALSDAPLKACVYRPQWSIKKVVADDVAPVKEVFPDLEVCTTLDDGFLNVIEKTRLMVSTIETTILFQALAMDVPCIFYFRPENQFFPAGIADALDRLVRVGVVHHSATSAAAQVNQVWDDVRAWWEQEERQAALNHFRKHWAWRKEDWHKDWLGFLRGELRRLKRKGA